MRIPVQCLQETFETILLSRGVETETARIAAENFTRSSVDGVYSHGVNRFPRVIDYLDRGLIDGRARPECVAGMGSVERWDGHMGLGNVNARLAMERACALAKQNGVGCVAMGNTNHWMRGGAYGWQAADAGLIGICWTNTRPNTPAWGSFQPLVGNNPFVLSVPRSDGRHIVMDCSMSQFSYGRIDLARMNGERLPVPGGWDEEGNLTDDPEAIARTRRVLPIGYWKGSGLSMVLDMIGAVLSGGNTVSDIGRKYADEIGLSQVFLALDPAFTTPEEINRILEPVLEDLRNAQPMEPGGRVWYPGERTWQTREENLRQGVPVNEEVWRSIQALLPR